jgi:hypothetical protein
VSSERLSPSPLGPATPPATNPDPPTVTLTPAAPIAAASTITTRGIDPEEERMLQMALCATASMAPHATTPSEPPFPPPSLRTPNLPSLPSSSPPPSLPAPASHPSPRASLRRTTAAKCADCGAFPSRCTCPPSSTPPLPPLLQPPANSLPPFQQRRGCVSKLRRGLRPLPRARAPALARQFSGRWQGSGN